MRSWVFLVLLVASAGVGAQNGGLIYFPGDEIFQTNENLIPTPKPTPSPQTVADSKVKPLPLQQNQQPQQLVQQSLRNNSKSHEMCRKYAEFVYRKVESFVGEPSIIDLCVNLEPLITNGSPAQPREFPHMALIGMQGRVKNQIKWSCGGSLISERHVLSAAHCNALNPKRVRLGDYNIRSTEDDDGRHSESVEFDIVEVIEHPKFDSEKLYNDVTLYKLDRDVRFNEYIRPICLHTEYKLPDGFGIISGWGRTDFGAPTSDILLKGNVSYVSGQECSQSLQTILQQSRNSEVRDEMMVCAGNFVNGTDTCQSDSGGPLQYRLSDPYCMYSQVGITSFGVRCGSQYPAIYTRVSNYVPWIESIVWP